MKQTIDLIYFGLRTSSAALQQKGRKTAHLLRRIYNLLCRICNPKPANSGFAIHTATSLVRRAVLLLVMLVGWGMGAVAQDVATLWTGSTTEQITLSGETLFNGLSSIEDKSKAYLNIYTNDDGLSVFYADWGNNTGLQSGATSILQGQYYISSLSCYSVPFSAFKNDFVNRANQYTAPFFIQNSVSPIIKITYYVEPEETDAFINEPASPCNYTDNEGDDPIERDIASATINLSGARLENVMYARIYLADASGKPLDPTGLLTVTYNNTAATAAGTNVKNGVYVYDGGNDLALSNVSVTLNAGAGNFTNYQIVCLLSNNISTATPSDGTTPLTQEPKWQEEYTYSFTYPIEVVSEMIDVSLLTGTSLEFNVHNDVLNRFGKQSDCSNMYQSWYGGWYVLDATGVRQSISFGNSQGNGVWNIQMGNNGNWFEGNSNGCSIANNCASASSVTANQQWQCQQLMGFLKVYAPSGSVNLSDFVGYKFVYECTDEYTSGTAVPKLKYIFTIPSTVQFEYDGTIGSNTPVTQDLTSRSATSVTLDWATMTTTGVKYARFFVVDSNGDPVDATQATHLLTVNGGTLCDNPASGYYVYNGDNDITMPTVTLSSTGNLLGYKVKCWLATATTNIEVDGNTVTEEPDITNEYVYSFVKPAPTTVEKTGTIAWGSSMQADATDGAPADWDTTWDALSIEQRVVWYVTEGTTKQSLALGTVAQSGTWVLNLPTGVFSVTSNEAVLTGQTTFTASEWNIWGKPAIYAPIGMAYADVQGFQVVCEVYETAAGTTPNVRYTFSFTKDFLGELKSGVTATTVPVVLADANAVSYELTGITLPTGAKYARFYLTDGSDQPVDPTGKLTVSGTPSTVNGHAEYGYYLYDVNGVSAPTVTLTLTDATLNQYKVVMVTSADNAVTESGAVINEPDYDTQTTWSFKYPVQHTEATADAEWSPASMTVALDIDALKGSGYQAGLGSNYHVVWTVEDGSGTAQTLTTGTSRQNGTWAYSVDGDNATFYAPSDATFADVQGLRFVARLYETATGENDADKSLTYIVSIVRTQFLGTLKDSGTAGSETVTLDDINATSVNVPLSHATLNGAKYARVWLTQNSTMVDPDGKLSLPTDMTAFGTNHDATYGYHLYNADGITLTDVTLSAPGSYSDYQVHVALSVDAPVSYPDFARDIVLRRAPTDAFEPDYDYEYTISFQDNSMKVIKIYAQADDGAQHGNDYNAGSTNNDKGQSFYDLITAAFTELGLQSTYTAANLFVKWNVIDKNGNYITLAQYYADNNQVRLSGFADNTYHASSDNKSVYVYYGQNPPSNASRSQLLNATLTFGNYVFQQGSVVEVWVTNVNSHTAADPADGYLVKLELHFNDDGLSPDDFPGTFSGTATALTHEMGYAETSTQITLSPATTGARYARYYLVKNGEEQAISSTAITLASSNGQTSTERPKRGVYVYNASGLTDDDLKVTVSLPVGTFEDYQLVAVFSDDAPTLNGTTITKEPTALDEKQVYSFVYPIVTIDKYIKWNRNSEQLNIAELLPTDLPSLTNTSTEGYICWSINDGSSNAVSFAGRHNGTPANWSMTLGSDNDNTQQAFSITANLFQWQWNNYTQPTVYAPNSDLFESYPSHTIVCEVSDVSAEKIRVRYVWHFTEDGHANDPFINRAKAGMVTGTGMEEVSRSDANGTFTLQEARTGTSFSETTLNGVKYVRVYVTDAEGNKVDYDTQVDGTNPLLTVTYNGTSATPAGNYPYNGLYVYDNGNTLDINNISITVNSGAGHLDQYQVVALLSTDEISATPQEPEWDCRYNYSFYYPAERIRLNLIQESQLGETSVSFSAEDMQARIVDYFSTTMSDFVNSSSSWYVKWYVEDYEGNRQHLEYNNQGAMNGVWTHTQGNNTSQTVDNSYFINNTNTTYDQYYYTPVGGMNFVTPSQTTLYDHRDLRFICEIGNSYDGTTAIPRVIYWIPIPDYFAGNLKTTGTKVEETFIVDADATSRTMNELGTQYTAFATATGATATDQVYVRLYVANLDGTIADNQEQYTFGTTLPAGFEYRADAGWVYLGSGLAAADLAAVTVNSTTPLCESGKKLGLVMAKAPFPRLNPEDASEINTAADIINEPQWDYQYLARFDQFLTDYAPLMKEETVTVRPGNADNEGRYTIDISAIADLSAGAKGFDAKYMRWYLADSNGNPLTEQYWAAGGGPNGNYWFITGVNPTAGMSHDHNEYNRASDNAKAYGQMWYSDTNEVQFGNLSFKVTTPTFNAGWGRTEHYPLENYQVVIFLSDNDDESALTQTVTTDPGNEGTTTTVLKEPTPDHKITIKFNSFFGDVNSETTHFEQTFRRSTEEWNEDCSTANSREYTITFDLKNKQVTLTHVGDATQSFSKTMSDEEVAFWTNNFAKENPDNPTVPYDQNFYFRWLLRNKATGETAQIVNGIQSATGGAPLQDVVQYNVYGFMGTTYYQSAGNRAPGSKYFSNYFEDTNKTMNYLLRVTIDGSPTGGDCFNLTDYDLVLLLSYDEKGEGAQATPWGENQGHYCLVQEPETFDLEYVFHFKGDFEADNIDDPTLKTKYKTIIYDPATRSVTPQLLSNYYELAGDMQVERDKLAEKGYARWYLVSKATGEPIPMGGFSNDLYTAAGGEYGYYKYKFNIDDLHLQGDYSHVFDPTITLPEGMSYRDVRVVCVTTTLTEPQDDNENLPVDMPNKEPRLMQVKYIYDLQLEETLANNWPFVHYQGVHYPDYHRSFEDSREFIGPDTPQDLPAEGTAKVTQYVWDYGKNTFYDPADNSYAVNRIYDKTSSHAAITAQTGDSPDYSTRDIRQKTHTMEYHYYLLLEDGQQEVLKLPLQYYDGDTQDPWGHYGSDTEPMGYIRWYDWTTDKNTNCITPTLTTLQGNVGKGQNLLKRLMSNGEDRGWYTVMTDLFPTQEMVGVNFVAPDGFSEMTDEIVIACDISRYMDGLDDSKRYLVHEPTLSTRYIYHILPAKVLAKRMTDAASEYFEPVMQTLTETPVTETLQFSDIENYDKAFHLLEYNGRTVVSLNGTTGNFSLRTTLTELDHYYVEVGSELKPCNNMQWYAYYEYEGLLYRLKVPMVKAYTDWTVTSSAGKYNPGDADYHREKVRLAVFELKDFWGEYERVRNTEEKINLQIQPGQFIHLVGCLGYDDGAGTITEVPTVSTELFFVDAAPQLLGSESFARTDYSMSSMYKKAAELTFDDFFDDPDTRFNKPLTSFDNYAKIPILFADAQYGFCYPRLYGQCATDYQIHNRGGGWTAYGVAPLHGDYTLLKSMNMPGISLSRGDSGGDGVVYDIVNQQTMYALWYKNPPLYDVTHERAEGKNTNETDDYGTFLYVDAADQSRTIGRLEFDAQLCSGAEIYYTAYIADMTDNITTPQVRFRVYTYNTDTGYPVGTIVDGYETQFLAGHTTSQTLPVISFVTGDIATMGATEKGHWYQVYGYCNLPSENHVFLEGDSRHFYVEVDNFCENTNGADYAVDEITFYTSSARVKIAQISDVCDDEKGVKIRISALASSLMPHFGLGQDREIFYRIYPYSSDPEKTNLEADEAITGQNVYCHEHATDDGDRGNLYGAVPFHVGYNDQATYPSHYDQTLYESLEALLNAKADQPDYQPKYGFYKDGDNVYYLLDERYFELTPGQEYFVSLYTLGSYKPSGLEGWGNPYGNHTCTAYSNNIMPRTMFIELTEDSDVSEGLVDMGCGHTTATKDFGVRMRYPLESGGYQTFTNLPFDFFLGTKTDMELAYLKDEHGDPVLEDYIDDNGQPQQRRIRLKDALAHFRSLKNGSDYKYPDACKTQSTTDPVTYSYYVPDSYATEDDHDGKYYQILKEYVEEKKLLLLEASSTFTNTFTLEANQTEVVDVAYLALPLYPQIDDDKEICSPITMVFHLDPTGGAPLMELGFDDVKYPADYKKRGVRLGLEQLAKMRDENYMLHIPISNYYDKKKQEDPNALYFEDAVLRLSNTNDPEYLDADGDITQEATQLIVTTIVAPGEAGSSNEEDDGEGIFVSNKRMYLPLSFAQDSNHPEQYVNFKEGYWYEVSTRYYDRDADAQDYEPNVFCYADLFIVFKVVPEFATWTSQPIGTTQLHNVSWHNDNNWKRSVRRDLYKDFNDANRTQNTNTLGHPDGYDNDGEGTLSYLTGTLYEQNPNPGFVPMKFTYVTLLTGNHAPSLINEARTTVGDVQTGGYLIDPNRTELMTDTSPLDNKESSKATDDIRYDMLVRYGPHSEGGEGCFGHRSKTKTAGIWGWRNDRRTDMTQFNADHKAFDVEKFYGNICKEIYFKPEAELLRQQRLTYQKAWVEKELVANRWYLAASPLKSTYAGDMYVPTKMTNVATNEENVPGQQLTEAFQPISFSTTATTVTGGTATSTPAYSRTKYPIYQRSWSTDGSKVYTKTNDARATDYSANLGYTTVSEQFLEWSHTYNDVQVPYSTLTGFSVRVDRKQHVKTEGSDQVDVPALLRLPKADTQYDYYDWADQTEATGANAFGKLTQQVSKPNVTLTNSFNGSTWTYQQPSQYRFITDDASKEQETQGAMEFSLNDLQVQGDYVLVGNPHVASLNMGEFFNGNPNLTHTFPEGDPSGGNPSADGTVNYSYWTYEGSVAKAFLVDKTTETHVVSTADGDTFVQDITYAITSDGNPEVGIIRPMQAFFVKKGTADKIYFTRDMTIDGNYPTAASSGDGNGGGSTSGGARFFGLTLRAAGNAGGSSATVRLRDEASSDYREGEDVETLFDSNLAGVPMVYTVAGGQAVSIDQRPQLDVVSFGVTCAASDKMTEVSFSGTDAANGNLYVVDAVTGSVTEVGDGSTFMVQPNDYGRYFLTTNGNTTVINGTELYDIVVSVRGKQVTVKSEKPLLNVKILTTGGVMVSEKSHCGTEVSFTVNGGVYIVDAETADGRKTVKLMVK